MNEQWKSENLDDTIMDHVVAIQIDHKKGRYVFVMSKQYTQDVRFFQIATGVKKPIPLMDGDGQFLNLHLLIEPDLPLVESITYNMNYCAGTKAYPIKVSEMLPSS